LVYELDVDDATLAGVKVKLAHRPLLSMKKAFSEGFFIVFGLVERQFSGSPVFLYTIKK
jgi:hypothetical protein